MPFSGDMNKNSGLSIRHECHCGKSFARKEHLTRHQATHDKRAFICSQCQRSFTRSDLLRRHVQLHESGASRAARSCEVCRVNKTKCSGGIKCNLCLKRGVECIYKDSFRRIPVSGSVGTARTSIASSPEASVIITSTTTTAATTTATPQASSSHAVDFFHSLSIFPSNETPRIAISPCGVSGGGSMETVYQALVAGEPYLQDRANASPEFNIWLAACLDTYLEKFHIRWPVIHAPTIDLGKDKLYISASVCMIATYFQKEAGSNEWHYAIQVHNILLYQLSERILGQDILLGSKPWPADVFLAILLNLIFGLYRSDDEATARITLLRSIFITLLREIGAFTWSNQVAQQEQYFPSTFFPYTMAINEKHKCLVAYLFKFDVHLAMMRGQPPMLHRQEMDLELPYSFSFWNSFGLDMCYKRLPDEPPGRKDCTIAEMTNGPDAFSASPLLVEDIIFGLAGLLQATWVLGTGLGKPATDGYIDPAFQRLVVSQKLDAWNVHLDRIGLVLDTESSGSGSSDTTVGGGLLTAYRAQDESKAACLARVSLLLRDARLLYAFLKLLVHANIRVLDYKALEKQELDPSLRLWRTEKNVRQALSCAISTLEITETYDLTEPGLNPLVASSLSGAWNVFRLWSSKTACNCARFTEQSGDAANQMTDIAMNLHNWVETGDGIFYNGVPVCLCGMGSWSERFQNALTAVHRGE